MSDIDTRIEHILEAIDRVETRLPESKREFDDDELLQVWTVYHLQIVGEAVRALPDDWKTKHSAIAWEDIAGMRNILVHEYFAIDLDLVWSTARKDLPELRDYLEDQTD